jgi:hypothetical protein
MSAAVRAWSAAYLKGFNQTVGFSGNVGFLTEGLIDAPSGGIAYQSIRLSVEANTWP